MRRAARFVAEETLALALAGLVGVTLATVGLAAWRQHTGRPPVACCAVRASSTGATLSNTSTLRVP